MKKSFTLVEILIAVALISVVIVALIKMGQNNLFLLEKFKTISTNNDYSSLAFLGVDENKTEDKNIYLDEVADFKDDDLRRELKEIKVIVKNEKLDDENIPVENFVLTKKVTKTKLTIENQQEKDFYRFKLVN
ncbi:MAG: prepilin-type N-terminal cleavage/methylation domain-containing protein [Arcobacteraceae bacterium]|nr:prepilin-type N-terminal cleavage/methylation domain-containing protein [Arcobacteraceae bacterium]